jgi:endonuclease III
MKDSKDYSPRLAKLVRSLKKGGDKPSLPTYSDPIEAIVYALISEPVTEAVAARTFKRLKSHFVDLNDLRVSRVEEIQDIMRDVSEQSEISARAITCVLNAIFEKTDRISLDHLAQEGKRQAHKALSEITGMTPFAVNYCFLTALGGHAIPLTEGMLSYLRQHEIVHPEASLDEISGFLERQIAASEAYEFYVLLRHEVEQSSSNESAAPAKKKATVKKTAKKTTAKKTKE